MRLPVAVVVITCCAMLFASCSSDSNSPLKSAEKTALPLQNQALVVGGDVQSRATDVFRVELSPEQVKHLTDLCSGLIEPGSDDSCKTYVHDLATGQGETSPPSEGCLCLNLRKFAATDLQAWGDGGYLEVTDTRPGERLCDANPDHVCARIGIASAAALSQLTKASAVSPTVGPTTPPETPTQTEAPNSTLTPSETETTTPGETTPNDTTSDTTSDTGTEVPATPS